MRLPVRVTLEIRNLDQIIYLDPADDVITIRDRVEMAEAKRVLLVVPPYTELLGRRVDLQIVQRAAARRGTEVALVTEDGRVGAQARELGLPVFDSIAEGKQRKRWRRPQDDADEEQWSPRRNDEAWTAARKRGQALARAARNRKARLILAWALFAAVLAALIIGAALTVPSANIVLIPRSEPVVVKLNAVIDPNIRTVDYARSRIPATAISAEVEGNAQAATSGQKDIPASRAAGKVIFLNQLTLPVSIPKGTAVRTSAFGTAIRFVTVADVTVPGGFGAQVEAPIEAVDVGVGSNVPANLINEVEGVAALAVRVTNPEPTRGGGMKQVPSVTQADKDRLRAALLQQLQQRAYAQMQGKLGEQEFVPPESLSIAEVLDETYDRFVTEEAPSLGLQMRVSVAGLKVGMQDANALVYAAMAAQVPPGYELIPNGLGFRRDETLVPADKRGNLTLVMRGTGYASARLDLEAVRRSVAGLSIKQARAHLLETLPLQADPDVQVWPDWFGHVPQLTFRTEIEVRPQG